MVGDNPKFLSDEVIYIPFEEHNDRAFNILDKLLHIFRNKLTSPDIFFMMDDIFFCSQIDVPSYEYFWRGYLPKSNRIRNYSGYNNSLDNTRNYLESKGLDIKHFGCHLPIIYNRDKFLEIDWSDMFSFSNGFSLRSVYGNYHKIKGFNRVDVKKYNLNGEADLRMQIKDIEAFSIADTCLNQGVEEYLQKEFPNKSRFEI